MIHSASFVFDSNSEGEKEQSLIKCTEMTRKKSNIHSFFSRFP